MTLGPTKARTHTPTVRLKYTFVYRGETKPSVIFGTFLVSDSVTRKKSPNVYESLPKMISLEKLKIFTTLPKLAKNVGDLGKLIVSKGFKKLPEVQNITQSGHTGYGS